MKLAGLGVVAIAVGLSVGEDGLALAGALWLVIGILLWALVTRHRRDRRGSSGDPAVDALQSARDAAPTWRFPVAIALVLTAGLGALAIGVLQVGFESGDAGRWVTIGAGALVTVFALINLALRLGGVDLEAAAKASEPQVPARVTIESKRQTGTYINEQPRIEFDLLVEPEGLPSYRVTKKATVPHTALSDIGLGDGFEARVDPGGGDRIAIDWNAPIAAGGDGDQATRLERLEELRRRGLIDGAEYESQRRRIIESI